MSAAVVIGGGVVATGLLLLFGRKKKKPPSAPQREDDASTRPRSPWLQPVWVPTGPNGDDRIREEICRQTDPSGTVLTPVLAQSVWKVIWQGVPWPVLATDHATVRQAQQILYSLIDEYLANPIGFCERYEPSDDEPDAPVPINIAEFEDAYPNDGLMYQVKPDDILGGTYSTRSIAYRTLLSAASNAAVSVLGLDQAAANQFALDLARNSQARARYIRLAQCDLFNDLYLTTEGFDANVTSGAMHADGKVRGLRLKPLHPDNRARLAAGLAPLRSIDIVTGVGTLGGKLEYLHLPLLDPDALANKDLPIDARIVPGTWADGSTGMLPPPPIQRLMNTAVVPSGLYGCQPNTLQV